jgi:hypothetical protein
LRRNFYLTGLVDKAPPTLNLNRCEAFRELSVALVLRWYDEVRSFVDVAAFATKSNGGQSFVELELRTKLRRYDDRAGVVDISLPFAIDLEPANPFEKLAGVRR